MTYRELDFYESQNLTFEQKVREAEKAIGAANRAIRRMVEDIAITGTSDRDIHIDRLVLDGMAKGISATAQALVIQAIQTEHQIRDLSAAS